MTGPLSGRTFTILGAGIGGLATALALARRGARVEVIERAPALREVGAGVQISPNGMRVLQGLGIADEVAAGAPIAEEIVLRAAPHGRVVTTLHPGRLKADAPWCLVHRADLIAALSGALAKAGVTLRFGVALRSAALVAEGVRLDMADGSSRTVAHLIAADGVGSVVRPLVNSAAPAFSGQVAWRALVPRAEPMANRVEVVMGPGRHLVRYPLRGGYLANIVAVVEASEWTPEGWQQPDTPEAMRSAFAAFPADVRQDLAHVRDVHRWGLFRHAVPEAWHHGPVVLLGDAVHPTLPFLAQGACMALEDAWVLAEALSECGTVDEAFAAYAVRRQARCRRIVAAADFNAFAYHLTQPMAAVGHAVLRLGGWLAPDAALRRFAWLYEADVTVAQASSSTQTGT